MKCDLCFLIFSLTGVIYGEPFSSRLNARTTPAGLDSVRASIQKLKEKTASISQAIERTAPAGPIGNLASSVIGVTTKTTAQVIRTTTIKIDAVAKDSLSWVKNFTSAYTDKGADFLVHKFQQYAIKNNLDRMQLPDIETKISGVTVKASGGYFSSFASLIKPKSINVTVSDGDILINIPLSLATFNSGYENFQAKFFFLSMSAGLSLQVKTNAINVILRLKAINPCALNVDRVEVSALEGLSITYKTDCKTCSSIISKITSGFANFMKQTLKVQIQEGIDKGVQNIIKEDSFVCAHFVKSAI
uniref:Putative translation initiation factor IF-2 n=1 Tax=Lygus hesperus TaxID=30085 RepID=A0A0A9WRF0_LYGHE